MPRHSASARAEWILLGAIFAVYFQLIAPNIGRQGIGWDEAADFQIAQEYTREAISWIRGTEIDLNQARLPMAVGALAFEITGHTDLATGRWASVVVGALTLLGTFVYGRRRLGVQPALLATAALAASPFFLSFARVAFTEADIYVACTFVWFLVCADRFGERPQLRRVVPLALLTGLAWAAKFTTLTILPLLWWIVLRRRERTDEPDAVAPRSLAAWIAALLGAVVVGWSVVHLLAAHRFSAPFRVAQVALVAAVGLAACLWAWRQQKPSADRLALAGFATALAFVTFLLAPPEHLVNTDMVRMLWRQLNHEMFFSVSFVVESATLFALSILFKTSPVLGAALLAGLAWTLGNWRRTKLRPALALLLIYLGGLLMLPLSQTFYVVPLLPILSLAFAEALAQLRIAHPHWAHSVVAAAALNAAVDLAACYPDFNLNGFQYVGERILVGRSSIGYRSIVQTPSDGVEQALDWLTAHAAPGDRVTAYFTCWHIVEAKLAHSPFSIASGYGHDPFVDPEFVVTHINDQLHRGDGADDTPTDEVRSLPYDDSWLHAHYDEVFRVTRAFGIEVAGVWRRRADAAAIGTPGAAAR